MKVSIIIPIYRVETAYFKECMDSVLQQKYQDIEVIVVDDGADDELCACADEFARHDNRVKVIHQENDGAAAARNAGLAASTGEYVTFVDSDDWIHEDTILEALSRICEDDLQVLMWGSYKCYGDKHEKYMPYTDDIRLFSYKQKEQLQLKTMVGWQSFYEKPASHFGSGSCCSKLYNRQFLMDNDLKYPVGLKRAEDVNFNIRVFERAERIGYLNRHFYYYRQLESSATYLYRENGIEVFKDALNSMRDFLVENNKGDIFYQTYYMRCMFFFLESMDMDYLNKENKDPFSLRIKKMREAASTEPFCEAIKNLRPSGLSLAKKIPYYLIKAKMMGTLCLFYGLYKKIS